MQKPKGKFSKTLGGNSAEKDIKALEKKIEAEKAQTAAPEKAASAKEKGKGKGKDNPQRAPKQPRPVREVVPPPLPLDAPAYDFRSLPDPEKTLQRVRALLSDPRLTHGERAAAALIVYQFQDQTADTLLINVKKVISETRGFSSTVRDRVIPKLSELGLVKSQWLRGKGTEITLLF